VSKKKIKTNLEFFIAGENNLEHRIGIRIFYIFFIDMLYPYFHFINLLFLFFSFSSVHFFQIIFPFIITTSLQ